MSILKKVGLYVLFFVLSTAGVCGINVVSYLVTKQPIEEIVADDGFLSAFVSQFTSSNDISADIDLTTCYNTETVALKGVVKVLMPNEENSQMALSLNCVLDSSNKQIPLQAIVNNGSLFLNLNGAKVIIQTTDAISDINSITSGLGVNFDFIKMFDINAIMDSLASLKAEPIENGYCAKLDIANLGIVNMFLDKNYNLKRAQLENVEISGVIINLNANINIDDEDFVMEDIPVGDDTQKDLTQVINFVKAVGDTFITDQFATDVNIQLGNFSISATIGIDSTSDVVRAYVKTMILGKQLLVVCDNTEAYINLDDLKIKINYSELADAINVVLDKYLKGIDVADLPKYIRDQIVKGLDNLAKNGSPLYDIISYIADFDISALLTRFEYDDAEKALVIKVPNNIDISLKKQDEKISNIFVEADNFSAVAAFVDYDNSVSINKSEYVDYMHYEDPANALMTIIDSKQALLNLEIAVNGKIYNADMCIDLMSSQIVSVKTTIEDFEIFCAVEDNNIYVSVNDTYLHYLIGTETQNIIEKALAVVKGLTGCEISLQNIQNAINSVLEEVASGVTIGGNVNLDDILSEVMKITLFSASNEKMHLVYEDIDIIFGLNESNLLSLEVMYNDISAKAILNTLEEREGIDYSKYVDITSLNSIAQTVLDVASTKQIALSGSVEYKDIVLPLNLAIDLNTQQYVINTRLLNVNIQVAIVGEMAYLQVDEMKYKMTLADIASMVQKYLGIDLLADIPELSLNTNIASILSNIRLSNANNGIEITYKDITFNFKVMEDKPVFTLNAYDILASIKVEDYTAVEINDEEYELCNNLENVIDTIVSIVNDKKLQLDLNVIINGYAINATIYVDLSSELQVEVQATIEDYAIKLIFADNTLYISVNSLRLDFVVPEQLNPIVNSIKEIYSTITKKELELPNIDEELEKLTAQNNVNIDELISNIWQEMSKHLISINNDGISISNANGVMVDVSFNTSSVLQISASYEEFTVIANLYTSKHQISIIENTININKLIDNLPAFENLVKNQKFTVSGNVSVLDYDFDVVANVDITDLSNIKIQAQLVVDSLTLNFAMLDNTIYLSFKGLNICFKVPEINDLLMNDVKDFIETNFQQTIESDELTQKINEKLITLEILENIIVEESIQFITTFGLDFEFVLVMDEITGFDFVYNDSANGNLQLSSFNGEIQQPSGEYTEFKTAIKIANGLIEFIQSETYNASLSIVANGTTVELKTNVITSTQDNVRVIDKIVAHAIINQDIIVEMLYENNYIYVSVNGLLVKLDLSCVANLVGVVTSLLGIDLAPLYDMLNIDIPGFDTEILQGLLPKSDESVEKQSIFDMLSSIQLAQNGETLKLELSSGLELVLTTTQADGKLLLNTFVLNDTINDGSLGVVANFYLNEKVESTLNENLNYIDISSLANFLKVLENTYNLRYYQLQGTASVKLDLGLINTTVMIDIYANIKTVKQENGEWKPYVEVLLNLPCNKYNSNLTANLAFENAVTGNDAQNHISRIVINDGRLHIYRTVYTYTKASILSPKVYATQVRSNVSYALADLSSNDKIVEMLTHIIGGSATLKSALKLAFNIENKPEDSGIDKYVVNNDKYKGYYYDETDSKYKIVLDGEYVISNSSIGYLFINIKDEQRDDKKRYLRALDFTMNIGSKKDAGAITVNIVGLKLLKGGETFVNNWNNSNAYNFNTILTNDLNNMINANSFEEFWANIGTTLP